MDGLLAPPRLHVLMIDPDVGNVARLRRALLAVEHDAVVTAVSRLESALAALRRTDITCVVAELDLPDRRGLDVLRLLRSTFPGLPVVVATDCGSEELAVAAMKLGAADYVRKHPTDASELLAAVRAAAGRAVLAGLDGAPGGRAPAASPPPDSDFVATTARMRQALLLVERAAHSRVPVLLEGETGTGKELLARAIHERGTRRHAPFVVQNCGAL